MKSLGPPELGPGAGPEPVRLLSGGSTAFERRLLSSAARDAMPAAALQHLAQALHVPSAALPTLGAELGGTAWLGKVAALAGLGALGVIAAVVASSGPAAPARASVASAAVPMAAVMAPAPTRVPEAVSLTQAALVDVPRADVPRAEPEPARPKIANPRPRAAARASDGEAAAPQHSEPRGLRAELQALEAVQRELRAQHPELAAEALAAYARRFPAGELAREAELLGVDIALARGDRELARARARELLSKPDGARYRERLDALRIESSSSAHGSAEVTR